MRNTRKLAFRVVRIPNYPKMFSGRHIYKHLVTGLLPVFLFSCHTLEFYGDAGKPVYYSGKKAKAANEPADSLDVVTFNIKKARKIPLAIAEMQQWEKRTPIDIYLLQEMNEKSVDTIAAQLDLNYLYIPIAYDKADKKDIGNAILTKGTIDHAEKLILPHAKWQNRQRRAVTIGEVAIHEKKILVLNMHTETVAMSRKMRRDQVDSVIRYARRESPHYKYVLIGGDFNAVFPKYSRWVVNEFSSLGFDWPTSNAGPTARATFGLVRPVSDYLFSKGFSPVANAYTTRSSRSSDHYPVLATLRFSPIAAPQDPPPKKKVLLPSAELLLAETVPWVVDECIRKENYTHLTWQSTRYNLSLNHWAWDNDPFTTNEFGHPFHGSLFYNAFRSNGYGFWESVPAAFAGSYLWETFAENQPPAPNDFINTGFGGITLGEMTHRLANKILDNQSRGGQRQVREICALLINPMNGLSRIIDGRWGRVYGSSLEHDSSNVYTEFDLGARRFKVNHGDGGFSAYGHLKLLYGTPFENYRTPFSTIYINAEFGADDSSKLNIISAYGSVKGWRLGQNERAKNLLMVSMNYDYIDNEAFFYSGQSIRLNLFSVFTLSKKVGINTFIGAGPVILSAVPDSSLYEGRNYDFCSGLSFHANVQLKIAGHLFYGINYRGGWMKTINGNADYHLLHAITSEFQYMPVRGFSLCAEPGYFRLNTYYKPDLEHSRSYPYLRISARYSFNL